MKKIYCCYLCKLKDKSNLELEVLNNKLSYYDFIRKYSTINIFTNPFNDDLKEMYNNYKEYLIELDNIDKIYKDEIPSELLFEITSKKNNDKSSPSLIPICLDGRLYVTKTFKPNVVREVVTGQLFKLFNNKSCIKIKNNDYIFIINGYDAEEIQQESEYKRLKYYLKNEEVVKYWINSLNKIEDNILDRLLEEKNRQEMQKKEAELKKQEERKRILEEYKEYERTRDEVKELLKKRD